MHGRPSPLKSEYGTWLVLSAGQTCEIYSDLLCLINASLPFDQRPTFPIESSYPKVGFSCIFGFCLIYMAGIAMEAVTDAL